MKTGPQTKKLSFEQIAELRKIQTRVEGRSLPKLREFMKAPFSWQTLSQALKGRPIWQPNYQFIVDWLERQNGQTETGSQQSGEPRAPKVPAVRS